MAGKPYTMREMRAIVEYLCEHKAYGEVKGRKMWMEFANSDKTTRTWQSLKETFLKRILPDIHNPYYKLTMDQVRSLREGVDVAEKEKKNRLEFQTVNDNLNAKDQNGILTATKDNEVPTTSHESKEQTNANNEPSVTTIENEVKKVTGEDIKAAKIPHRCRSSADTIVLEYENAEDVQRALESPNNQSDPKKSLKDLLTFENSAPLTPLVQNLLDDFETDTEESDSEPRLNIDEDLPQSNNTESGTVLKSKAVIEEASGHIELEAPSNENVMINNEADSTIEIVDTENLDSTEVEPAVTEAPTNKDQNGEKKDDSRQLENQNLNSQTDNTEHNNNQEKSADKQDNQNGQKDDGVTNTKTNLEDTIVFETAESNPKSLERSADTANNTECNSIANTGNTTQNSTADTLLPNNQEALDESKKEAKKTKDEKTKEIVDKEKSKENRLGKRSSSRDSRESKKLKLSNVESKEISDEAAVIAIVDSPSPIFGKKPLNANTAIVENNTNTKKDYMDEQFNSLLKQTSEIVNIPNKNTEKEDTNTTMHQEKDTTAAEDKNPCLLSVSLFEEQFKNTKYSGSDSDNATKQKQKTEKPLAVTDKLKEKEDEPQKVKDKQEAEVVTDTEVTVVVDDSNNSNSNLDSSADCKPRNQRVVKKAQVNKTVDLQRERALANVFGFTHGNVASSNRKRRLSHRRKSHHYRRRQSKNMDSNSSEWTSESDDESYVSSPRGRRHRQTKKYLKPKLSRILQDPEEGMLYVIIGKSIYPLVKDGKHIKKFLTYRPDSGSDEGESFWKKKYAEEKKRVQDISRLLKDAQNGRTVRSNESTPSTSRKNANTCSSQESAHNRNSNNATAPTPDNKAEENNNNNLLLKIKNDGLEYSLEGDWIQITNAMPQIMKLVRDGEGTSKPTTKKVLGGPPKAENPVVIRSRESTPVLPTADADVHEKVNKIEDEIFNKIKNLEVVQIEAENKESVIDSTNVTKRKIGKPQNTTSKPAKRARSSKTNSTDSNQEKPKTKSSHKIKLSIPDPNQEETQKTVEKQKDVEKEAEKVEEQKDVEEVAEKAEKLKDVEEVAEKAEKQKDEKEAAEKAEKQKDVHRNRSATRSSSRLSKRADTSDNHSIAGDSAVVETKSSRRKPKTSKEYDTASKAMGKKSTELYDIDDDNARYMFPPQKSSKNTAGNKNRSLPEINIVPPQETLGDSIDGYQDSDPSPVKNCLPKRKMKVSFTTRNTCRNKRISRRKSCPILLEPISESNSSSYFIPLRRSLSSLNSEVYRSDSYQILMPEQNRFRKLESIDENNPASDDHERRHFNSVSKDSNQYTDNSGFVLEIGSSSNVTLPCSPELSVVEKMSISREMIRDANHPTINEAQQNLSGHLMEYSEYMISNLDVSVPLMDQRCQLRKSVDGVTAQNASKSESVQLKDCTVDLTLSETLDQRLRELLLESTKKPTQVAKQTPMEVDQTTVTAKKPRARKRKENVPMDVDESKITTRQTRHKKRSSTPQKKKTAPKSKGRKDSIIEEEHVESCSAGRKSCPPVMTFIPIDENANNSCDVILNPAKVNPRKKKDVIKVKIQKPRYKSRSEENLQRKSAGDGSVASTYTDSGINDTETISLVLKDSSVDLIHNHSETCLLANECIANNSVEFVENSAISILTLSSSRETEDSAFFRLLQNPIVLSEDTSNNLDNIALEARTSDKVVESPETKNPISYGSFSSLITEDLSNSPAQPTKWYLFDEDVTNTESASNMPTSSFGSNLKEIFPIACAVPNLSTISEMSKENEDSRKTNSDL